MSGRDTWIATLISFFIGILWVVFFVMNTGHDRFAAVMKKPAGKIIGLALLAFFIESAVVMIYDFLSFFSTILPRTPSIIFNIVLVMLCAYAISKGFETVARVSVILIFLNFMLIATGLLSGLNKVRIENMLPVLENGIKPVAQGAVFHFSSIGGLLTLYVLPLNIGAKENKKAVVLAMIIIYLLIAALSTLLVGIFGVGQESRMIYKFFGIFQSVVIREIFRMDSVFIALWFITFLIKVSVLYYACVKVLQMILGVETYKCLLAPTGVILVALVSLSFTSYIQYVDFYVKSFAYMAIAIQMVVPLSLLLVKVKKPASD